MSMKDLPYYAMLYDFYGKLLTQRQQQLMEAYYLEDLSLAEIADNDGVSRQSVHDLIKRSEAALQEYEAKLGFIAEYRRRQETYANLRQAIEQQDGQTALKLLAALEEE